MGYLTRVTAGLALMAAGLTAVEFALYHLIQAGTCISDLDFIADTGFLLSPIDHTGSWDVFLRDGTHFHADAHGRHVTRPG